MKIHCCNSENIYFGESKRCSKLQLDERKRFVKNDNFEKSEIVKHFWEFITTLA